MSRPEKSVLGEEEEVAQEATLLRRSRAGETEDRERASDRLLVTLYLKVN